MHSSQKDVVSISWLGSFRDISAKFSKFVIQRLTGFFCAQILDEQFAEQVFTLALEMLGQWSKPILEAWIGVFAKLLPVLAK